MFSAYPLTGQSEYGWRFAGVDVDAGAIKSARQIGEFNRVDIRLSLQRNPENIFRGLIQPDDTFRVTMCNPQFHGSIEQVNKGTQCKWASLGKGRSTKLNFGSRDAEIWYPGGEVKFIARMVNESTEFAQQCLWFTSLVFEKDNLRPLHRILGKAKVVEYYNRRNATGSKSNSLYCLDLHEEKCSPPCLVIGWDIRQQSSRQLPVP